MEELLKIEAFPCRFLRRLNRFVGEVRINGKVERAWLNNTGKLPELKPGTEVFCTRINGRKLKLKLVAFRKSYVGFIDTNLQEKAFALAVNRGLISWVYGCRVLKKNPRFGRSRFDFILGCGDEQIIVETKSAVLKLGKFASYPDTKSERGREHIKKLTELSKEGKNCALVFISAVSGVSFFRPNYEVDLELRNLLEEALKAGVVIRAVKLEFSPESGKLFLADDELPVVLAPEKLNKVMQAINEFNSRFSPEAKAKPVIIANNLLEVSFSGSFCRTCGFYDYFFDFEELVKPLKYRVKEIIEFEEGALVRLLSKPNHF